MPKSTVLELVQDILSEMDSDNVNSINDTEEAYQVARIIQTSYFEAISSKYNKHFDRVKALESVADSTRPNYLKLPADVIDLKWIKYNDVSVAYSDPEEFLDRQFGLTANITTVSDFGGISYKIQTNRDPLYWTSFDEDYIVFDSYDSAVDSVLQSSKSKSSVYVEPVFTLTDTFTPDLPLKMFPQLLAEAKSTSFSHIKQLPSQKAEQRANRQRRRVSTQSRVNNGIQYNNYGRK